MNLNRNLRWIWRDSYCLELVGDDRKHVVGGIYSISDADGPPEWRAWSHWWSSQEEHSNIMDAVEALEALAQLMGRDIEGGILSWEGNAP